MTELKLLNAHTIAEIDEWLGRYPADKKKSALLEHYVQRSIRMTVF